MAEMHTMRILIAALLVSFLPMNALACTVSVSTKFTEMAPNFSVQVQFRGKPLAGVEVTLSRFGADRPVSSRTTDTNGLVQFNNLQSGKYFVQAVHRGIRAGSDQIEVATRRTALTKSALTYRWGESVTEVAQIKGTVVDLVPQGTGLERIIRPRIETPIVGAQIQLKHPRDNSTYATTTNEEGKFAIDGVPNGAYVMHVRTTANSAADEGDFLIEMKPAAAKDSLKVVKGDLCGGPFLFLQPEAGKLSGEIGAPH
jgi:hypothetical protein